MGKRRRAYLRELMTVTAWSTPPIDALPYCPCCGGDLDETTERTIERPGRFGPFDIVWRPVLFCAWGCREVFPSGPA